MGYCRRSPNAVARIQGGMDAPQLSECVQFYQEKKENCPLNTTKGSYRYVRYFVKLISQYIQIFMERTLQGYLSIKGTKYFIPVLFYKIH